MIPDTPDLGALFDAAMDRLGPFEPRPTLAVAVSGGADSMALAVLARDWARRRQGRTQALVVDHGLRAASAAESAITVERLARLGIPAIVLALTDLHPGPALAERARDRRYAALTQACQAANVLHLLLGHHAADQRETLAMRVLSGSQTHGLAGMAALRETASLRLLRPMLEIEPSVLRACLTRLGVEWVEDPSNQDLRATRPRVRHRLGTVAGSETGLADSMRAVAALRAREETATAAELAEHVTIRPEGFAVISGRRISAAAWTNVVRAVGGAFYAASQTQIAELAADSRASTLAGVRIMAAGRAGEGLLVVREEAAIADPVGARHDTVWDRRFRLVAPAGMPQGATIGKLGDDTAALRAGSDRSDLPSVVLRTLPAIRIGKFLAAVPHLGYAACDNHRRMTVLFSPPRPAAGQCFAAPG